MSYVLELVPAPADPLVWKLYGAHCLNNHDFDSEFLAAFLGHLVGPILPAHVVDHKVRTFRSELLTYQSSQSPTDSSLEVVADLGVVNACLEPPVTKTFRPFNVYGIVSTVGQVPSCDTLCRHSPCLLLRVCCILTWWGRGLLMYNVKVYIRGVDGSSPHIVERMEDNVADLTAVK